jgi:DNA-binding transcriptional LysR family regulator
VSQSLRRLEERLGLTLIHRTTRSVSLTAAGERLYAAARPALDDLKAAVAAASELSDTPRGTLRLHVAAAAQSFLSAPLLAAFIEQHPNIQLDVFVSDQQVRAARRSICCRARLPSTR